MTDFASWKMSKIIKSLFFSKSLKHSGDDSYRVWMGLGMSFWPQNNFTVWHVDFEKTRFFGSKHVIFEPEGTVSKTQFLPKNRFFSKFFKLSGNGFYRVWTALRVLFQPQNDFTLPHVHFEENRFSSQKMVLFSPYRLKLKNAIFWTKKSIFLKIDLWYSPTVLSSKQHP